MSASVGQASIQRVHVPQRSETSAGTARLFLPNRRATSPARPEIQMNRTWGESGTCSCRSSQGLPLRPVSAPPPDRCRRTRATRTRRIARAVGPQERASASTAPCDNRSAAARLWHLSYLETNGLSRHSARSTRSAGQAFRLREVRPGLDNSRSTPAPNAPMGTERPRAPEPPFIIDSALQVLHRSSASGVDPRSKALRVALFIEHGAAPPGPLLQIQPPVQGPVPAHE